MAMTMIDVLRQALNNVASVKHDENDAAHIIALENALSAALDIVEDYEWPDDLPDIDFSEDRMGALG